MRMSSSVDGNKETMFEDTRPKEADSIFNEKRFKLFDGESDPVD